MIKYNRNFAKQNPDGTPAFAPMPLRLEIPHHEEWDEDIIDPETGEPTGEKEHKEYDWVEKRTVIHPKKADILLAGYKHLYDTQPGVHEEGKHWEYTGRIADSDTFWRWEYVLVDDPPPAPRVFSKIDLEAAVFKRGLLAKLDAFVDAQTITNKTGDTMPLRRAYNTAQTFREDHPLFAPYLEAAKQALGVDDETAEAILSEAVAVEN